jgi:hypothetical protein
MSNTLDKLESLSKAATPGPWDICKGSYSDNGYCHFKYGRGPRIDYFNTPNIGTKDYSKDLDILNKILDSDAELIAAMRNSIDALIKVARAAQPFVRALELVMTSIDLTEEEKQKAWSKEIVLKTALDQLERGGEQT